MDATIPQSNLLEIMREGFPIAREKMAIRIQGIIEAIRKCDPVVLLAHCRLHQIHLIAQNHRPVEDFKDRALEYIQNILITHSSIKDNTADIRNMRERCERVICDVEDLYHDIQLFILCYETVAFGNSNGYDIHDHSFEALLQMGYLIRGKRDSYFNERYFSLMLNPHESTFLKFFGLGANDIIQGILNILKVLGDAKCDTVRRWASSFRRTLSRREKDESSYRLQADEFWKSIEDISIFEVERITGWPKSFIDQFSYGIGEACPTSVYDYQFWPIDDLAIKDHPFIKIGEQSYCFDYYNFQDNFYRAIFKAVRCRDSHGDLWHLGQTVAIESAAAEVFGHLMPGLPQYRNIYYYPTGKKKDRRQLDLVLQGPDVTFFIEAKGVCLEHASPIIDGKKAKSFYEHALKKAREQCDNLRDYIRKCGELCLFTDAGERICKLARQNLKNTIYICLTADSANEVSSSPLTLNDAGILSDGIMYISLDDLLIYEKFFDSPMIFFAYIEQRIKATFIHRVFSSDELDHLGMFLYNPKYADWLKQQDKTCNLMIGDNRLELDPFFKSLEDPSVKSPSVYLPPTLKWILDEIWSHNVQEKYLIASLLVGLDNAQKDRLSHAIEEELDRQNSGLLARVCSCPNLESESARVGVSVYLHTPYEGVRDEWTWKKTLFGVMIKFHEVRRIIIHLIRDPAGQIMDARVEVIEPEHMPNDMTTEVSQMLKEIDSRVVKRVIREQGCPGRNDQCPCGSGLKYKHCCGR